MTCTGCPHLPHRGACGYTTEPGSFCGCAIVTLATDACGCAALEAKIDRLTALAELLAARTEYMVDAFEKAHELHRYVDLVAARVTVLEAWRAASGNGNGEAP
jgi:hypothetical protein